MKLFLSTFLILRSSTVDADCSEGLFTVTCDVTSGFTVNVKDACQKADYAQLTGKLDKIFAGHEDLDKTPKAVTPASNCYFSAGGSITYGFDTCGTSTHSEGTGYTVFTSYLNHRVNVGGVTASLLDQTKIECRFSNVELESKSDVSPNDEKLGDATISGTDLKTNLNMALEAGEIDASNNFNLIGTKKIDVGKEITIKLKADTGFSYALTDCKASGANGASPVTLYGGTGAASAYCPNTASAIVKLNKVDSSQFKLNLFRIGQETSLTFTCTVKVFPEGDLPNDATTCIGVAGRKRRAAMARQQARQQEEEVEVVVQLSDSEKKATGSAAETCANIVIPTLFLASLF